MRLWQRRTCATFTIVVTPSINDLVAPVELVGLARREGQRDEGARRRTRMRFAPAPRISPDGVVSASVAERPQLLENSDQRHPLARRRVRVPRQPPIAGPCAPCCATASGSARSP